MWRPIASLPKAGQVLVTSDDLPGDAARGDNMYGDIELVICPMHSDGRILNQNSGNYTRAGVWKWWMPAPPRDFETQN